MPYKDTSLHCNVCERKVLARRKTPNHTLHAVAVLLTAGMWLIVWLFITIYGGDRMWRCWTCGSPLRSDIV
jgi:hypothetical protein